MPVEFSSEYAGTRFAFTNGTIVKVVFDIAADAYIDIEAHLAAALARDCAGVARVSTSRT